MTKILFLEDEPQLLDRIAFVLESVKDIEVLRASDKHQALEILESHRGQVQLVILDYRKVALNTLGDLQKAAQGIDCILCVDSTKTAPITAGWNVVAVVERTSAPRLLRVHLEQWKHDHPGTAPSEATSGVYVRIKTKLLIDISPLLSDIYVRLSERKYIKLFLEGDVFDTNDLSRYAQEKKIEYMYLLAENCHEFIDKYIQFIEEKIRSNKTMSIEEISYMHGSIHESVQELTEKLGFTRDVQALAKTQVQLTLKTMGKKPNLRDILKHLDINQGNYPSDHCFLVGYVACAIASHLAWGSETTFHKLTLAAFMHDIVLTDERFGDAETIEELQVKKLPVELIDIFKKHPAKVAEMARQLTEIPADVDSIVAQHHELPDGSGFPRGLNARNISPLSVVFIIAHAITRDVLKSPDNFKLDASLERLSDRFPQAPFRKALVAAKELSF